jgi:DHA1 family tetracycline resistance protein-like MFS transporter
MADAVKPPRFAVFLIVLLDVMGLGLIIPSQPFLAQHFGASPATVTLVGTTYALMQFVFAPAWGMLSDRFGRKPILATTLALSLVGHCLFAWASTLFMLFMARALSGIGAANISTAQAVLSDTHPPSERSRAMAIIGAAFGVGFVLGPALGGILSHLDPESPALYPALFAATLALLNIFFVVTRVPETRFLDTSAPSKKEPLLSFLKLDKQLQILILTTFLTMTAFALMEQTIGLFIGSLWAHGEGLSRMREATSLTSVFLVVVGITAVAVQGYFVRKWLKTTSEVVIFKGGLITIGISLALIPALGWIGSFPLFLVSGALLALGSGMFNPAMAGLVSQSCPSDKQGVGLALNQSGQALGRIVGPTVAGTLFSVGTSMPFVTGATLAVIALCVSSLAVKR